MSPIRQLPLEKKYLKSITVTCGDSFPLYSQSHPRPRGLWNWVRGCLIRFGIIRAKFSDGTTVVLVNKIKKRYGEIEITARVAR